MRRHLRALLPLSVLPLLACAVDATGGSAGETVASTSEELLTDTQLPDVPSTPVPAGYGMYCSVGDAWGNWALGVEGAGSDPCGQMRAQGDSGAIQRAGYWSLNGNNNVMVRCGGTLYMYRGQGSTPIGQAYSAVTGLRGCEFTIAPVALPAFTSPIASFYVPAPSVYSYDVYTKPWNPALFGQSPDFLQAWICGKGHGTPGDTANPHCSVDSDCTSGFVCRHQVAWDQATCIDPRCAAVGVDRTGQEDGYAGTCSSSTSTWDCSQVSENGPTASNEPAYDWGLPAGTSLIAVADGIVRGSQCRDVHQNGGGQAGDCQEELFIESQVGSGPYAEHFVAAYHHMDWNGHVYQDPNTGAWQPLPPIGHVVHRGDLVGIVGNSGTQAKPGQNIHLDFQVLRLTNLTSVRSYTFQAQNSPSSLYGHNGRAGIIDPFGWAGPQQIDPGAWMFIGFTDPNGSPGVTDPGAFSINLWETMPFYFPVPPTVGPSVQ